MTVNTPDRPETAHPGTPGRRPRLPEAPPQRRRPGPSPEQGEFVRPLTRRQIDDRMRELGELYTHTSFSQVRASDASNQDRSAAFRRRLAGHMRWPGFELLVAETAGPSGVVVLTACAYGFPVRGDGPSWDGLDGYLPESLLRVAAFGRLFAIADILVERRVRTQDQSREWNLARRLQKRLLSDHPAALGVTLVDRDNSDTLEALLSWGWRCLSTEAREASHLAPSRLLVLR
ncbi:hypothetical protein F7R91_12550 [Streptomyces luteolifulvus]|jgi:hypothetical protein|uniref:Uncharacterized protein n=1 Tax=Streptomyces luteolifulvus TaxID=2615112 RepID=A0A6H9V2L9_9ACTN|nr:hypothetical protein [Streptomyces luteolifulvus]KAB1147147.1 hypothetical protein F7R91_12550 [Streptomyces luteolifulvus]